MSVHESEHRPMGDDVWYFAYGSNLDPARKEERTLDIRWDSVTHCYLKDHRLAFNKPSQNQGPCANVVPATGQWALGVCYRCTQASLRRLDKDEGAIYEGHYIRKTTTLLRIADDQPLQAEIYIYPHDETSAPEFRPKSAYLNRILKGMREHGFPPDDIDAVRRHAESLPVG